MNRKFFPKNSLLNENCQMLLSIELFQKFRVSTTRVMSKKTRGYYCAIVRNPHSAFFLSYFGYTPSLIYVSTLRAWEYRSLQCSASFLNLVRWYLIAVCEWTMCFCISSRRTESIRSLAFRQPAGCWRFTLSICYRNSYASSNIMHSPFCSPIDQERKYWSSELWSSD